MLLRHFIGFFSQQQLIITCEYRYCQWFETPLLLQSFVMVVTQLVLLHKCVRVRQKEIKLAHMPVMHDSWFSFIYKVENRADMHVLRSFLSKGILELARNEIFCFIHPM